MISTFCLCSPSSSSFEEAYLNNRKINQLESLHVEMYHYWMGNIGITLFTLVFQIIISPSNVL